MTTRSGGAVLLVIAATLSWKQVDAADVYASSAQLKLLADGEKVLEQALSNYIANERTRLDSLQQSVKSHVLIQRALIHSIAMQSAQFQG